jgi:hypothetical protein
MSVTDKGDVMLEVKIPVEIRAYKGKVILGFNMRQLISIIASFALGGTIGYFSWGHIPQDIYLWFIIISTAPIIAWGFAKIKGMTFERFVSVYIDFTTKPQKRVYKDSDSLYYAQISDKLHEREIMRQRIYNGEIIEYEDDDDNEYDEEQGDK